MILRRIRQPSVIAEIIAGIVLGPSVFGYIPGYIDALFPSKSLPTLQMIALLGLIFYLFIVGLELDVSMLQRRFRQSVAISLAGMLIPFALSTGTAYLLWKIYVPTQSFGSFYLFLGTAMSITAFPVLARILGELHLFTTPVGAQTIAAAAVDDCAAWGLLALVMGIVSATTPLNALYIILLTLAFFLFMMSIIRPLISRWFSGGLSEDGTVAEWVVITALLLVIASALLTQIIGVHAIFGGFIAGLIMPREHNLPIALTEKIEDLVSKLLLPLYFAYSGLRTNIGQLQDAEAWGMVVLVVATACVGKILGCFLAARMTRLNNREALAVGLLMNCKG
jgi:Kef-type K+ transport system membrane component KefB